MNGIVNKDENQDIQTGDLDYINTSVGYTRSGSSHYDYHYFLTDHLDNTRRVFKENGNVATSLASYDYYPFGKLMVRGTNINENKYLY
ncbi:hypothetical protein EYV94_27820 [Puteibacter caeruleilacunae]|nr:hypothetical protein EYV94_27820 [Puteibacter caeruleilacunae]